MLPDFPKLKSDISARLRDFLRLRFRHHLGPLSEIQRYTVFEGAGKSRLVRSSGEIEDSDMTRISAEFSIKNDEILTMTLESLLERLDEVAKAMAQQFAQHTYQKVSEAVEKVGNVVDARQRKLSAEIVLEALSKIQIDFGPDGKPIMPSFHIHPDLTKAAQLVNEQFEQSPDLRKQYAEIMQDKKEKWRAREASRRLVG